MATFSSITAASIIAAIDDATVSAAEIDRMVFAFVNERVYPLAGADLEEHRAGGGAFTTEGIDIALLVGRYALLREVSVSSKGSREIVSMDVVVSCGEGSARRLEDRKIEASVEASVRGSAYAMLKAFIQVVEAQRSAEAAMVARPKLQELAA